MRPRPAPARPVGVGVRSEGAPARPVGVGARSVGARSEGAPARPAGVGPRSEGAPAWPESVPTRRELAEADQLIQDLGALVDAGLVVVHERVLGPARYGVRPNLDDVA
jgi:hypothetical protein